jgi:hypothetical protein
LEIEILLNLMYPHQFHEDRFHEVIPLSRPPSHQKIHLLDKVSFRDGHQINANIEQPPC